MKKSNLMPSIVLGCICLVAALLLSVINKFTAPIIAKNQSEAATGAFAEVLPGATGQVDLVIDSTYPSVVKAGYKFDNGYIFQMEVTGKSAGLIILCGIDLDGKITGTKVIADQETDTYDVNVFPLVEGTSGSYTGMTLDSFSPFLVSGATLTSAAYGEAIKAALQAFAIAKGESVDVRTPEQIFQDNCNAALGTEGKTFTKWFATEIVTGVDAVYETADNSGRVYAIGENLVGVKNGAVTTAGASASDKAAALAADTVIASSGTLTDVTSELTAPKFDNVTKAYVTASGNYVFEVKGEGYKYASNSEYAGIEAGQIEIKISISSDGKIIDVVTTKHQETKGYGDKCATDEYYDQYRGSSSSDIVITESNPDFHEDLIPNDCTDIGAIANATFTTYGYQSAVKLAFEAFELLTA